MIPPSSLVLSPGRGWFDLLQRLDKPSKSFKACLFLLIRSSLDQSKRARVYEHRHPGNPIVIPCARFASTRTDQADPPYLVCASGEQERSTDSYVPLSACHSGSTGAIGVSFLSWSFQARSYFSHKGAPLG